VSNTKFCTNFDFRLFLNFVCGVTNTPILFNGFQRWRQRCTVIRCHYNKREGGRARAEKKNYYELLGISVDSNAQKIKEAYRKLQKKYHPDIAGQKVISFRLFFPSSPV
jgi:hypothetical protein